MPPKKAKKIASKKKVNLVIPGFARYFLMFLVLSVLGLFAWVISPFFNVLIYAILVSIIFFPVYEWLSKKLKNYNTIAAFLTSFLVFLTLVVPMSLFAVLVVQEAADSLSTAYTQVEPFFEQISSFSVWQNYLGPAYSAQVLEYIQSNLVSLIQSAASTTGSLIFNNAFSLFKTLAGSFFDFVLGLCIFLLSSLFFFRDGRKLMAYLKHVSPLPEHYEDEIFAKLKETTYAIVMGNFGTSMIQGAIGALGFLIAGVDNIFFWGTLMAFASLIPYVGASIVWGPVSLYFLFQAEFGWFIFICLWGFFAVSTVDNFVRPILIGGSARMHPLPMFLVVLGGILLFGLKGIIFGPLILGLLISVLHIYQMEYREELEV